MPAEVTQELADFRTETISAIRRGFCTLSETAQDWGLGLAAGAEYRGVSASVNILRFLQRLTCDREPDPEEYGPPFSGGQCSGVAYDVTVFYEVFSAGVLIDTDTRTLRPNGAVYSVVPVFDNELPGTSYQIQLRVDPATNSGNAFYNVSAGSGGGPYSGSATIVSVVRVDGLPDTCGDPDPQLPPSAPGDRTFPTSYTYTNNEGDTIDVDATIRYGDISVDVNGDLQIGGRIEFTGDPFSPEINFNYNFSAGEGTFKPGNPNYPPSGNANGDGYGSEDAPPYPPSVPNSIAPPSPNNPEDDSVQVIRAVIVTVTANSSDATGIFQGTNPDIFAPNLGFINFGIATGGVISWTSDIPVKNYRNFIACPWEGGALQVRGTPRGGVSWTLTPVYASADRPQVYG